MSLNYYWTFRDFRDKVGLVVPVWFPLAFLADQAYAVSVKYIQGSGQFNLTDLNLVDDQGASVFDLQPSGNVQFSGNIGSGTDFATYLLTPNGAGGLAISNPILGDLQDSDSDGINGVSLNSRSSNTSFDLDLGVLELTNSATSDPTGASSDLVGQIERIDIRGSSNEDNTLTLSAEDVVNVTNNELFGDADPASFTLEITGNAGDGVNLADTDGLGAGTDWVAGATSGGFTTWSYGTVDVKLDTDLSVQVVDVA